MLYSLIEFGLMSQIHLLPLNLWDDHTCFLLTLIYGQDIVMFDGTVMGRKSIGIYLCLIFEPPCGASNKNYNLSLSLDFGSSFVSAPQSEGFKVQLTVGTVCLLTYCKNSPTSKSFLAWWSLIVAHSHIKIV